MKADRNGQKNETETIDSQNVRNDWINICILKETHIIERIGSDRKGYWKIL